MTWWGWAPMAERGSAHLWIMRSAYAGLCFLVLFVQLLPLDTLPRVWAAPELILLVTFTWALRRPEFVPAPLIAFVFILADLLLQRPPGLWAALVLIAAETLKARSAGLRDLTFPAEWFTMAVTLVAITLIYRVVLSLLLIDQAPVMLSLVQMVMTLIAYPLVVLISKSLFGIRKRAPGELTALGQRI